MAPTQLENWYGVTKHVPSYSNIIFMKFLPFGQQDSGKVTVVAKSCACTSLPLCEKRGSSVITGCRFYTGVGKSRFTFVRMEKDMQVMIITIAL
jgi:hypothetical protein